MMKQLLPPASIVIEGRIEEKHPSNWKAWRTSSDGQPESKHTGKQTHTDACKKLQQQQINVINAHNPLHAC
jgi:hypothetical protein